MLSEAVGLGRGDVSNLENFPAQARFHIFLWKKTPKSLYLSECKRKGYPMEVQISGKAAEIISAKVASGIYADAAEFISDIVLRADEFDQVKLEKLRRELQLGIDQLNRGEGVPLDADKINRAIDRKLKHAP